VIINHYDLYLIVNNVCKFSKLIDMKTNFVQDHQYQHLLHATKRKSRSFKSSDSSSLFVLQVIYQDNHCKGYLEWQYVRYVMDRERKRIFVRLYKHKIYKMFLVIVVIDALLELIHIYNLLNPNRFFFVKICIK
jgi:hypothetical protein